MRTSSDSTSTSSSSYDECTWLEAFLHKSELEDLLTPVPMTYFQESLSLYGLEQEIDYFREALQLIVDNTYDCEEGDVEKVERAAAILYAKAHQRYIKTAQALEEVRTNYQNGTYGECPRLSCQGQHLLPFGPSSDPGKEILRFYCPCCRECYKMYQINADMYVDGCFFGPDLVGIFMASYPEFAQQVPKREYVPRVYGFELYRNVLGKRRGRQ